MTARGHRSTALLEVEQLEVRFETPEGILTAVNGIGFSLQAGASFGIVGESGSGKTQSMLAILGLLAANGRVRGQARFAGQDLLALKAAQLNRLRGNRIAMIFQDPMSSLNPYLTVERQLTEVLQIHRGVRRADARKRARAVLESVQIADPDRCLASYPHQFSGGMRQRIMIAMALLCEPELIIADEPTTALDVTVQAQIVSLLKTLQKDHGTSIVMITHDLGLVAGLCDQVMVLYGGRVMEQGSAEDIFYRPAHPYTLALLNAAPRLHGSAGPLVAIPGAPPNLAQMPPGCPFAPRCALADARCAVAPQLLPVAALDGQPSPPPNGAQHRGAIIPTAWRACHRPPEAVTLQAMGRRQP